VAVERPHARVASGIELDHDMAVAADLDDIAALGVASADDAAVPGARAFVEDVHVEAVQMHRVAEYVRIVCEL
jgi:hypothetical protein